MIEVHNDPEKALCDGMQLSLIHISTVVWVLTMLVPGAFIAIFNGSGELMEAGEMCIRDRRNTGNRGRIRVRKNPDCPVCHGAFGRVRKNAKRRDLVPGQGYPADAERGTVEYSGQGDRYDLSGTHDFPDVYKRQVYRIVFKSCDTKVEPLLRSHKKPSASPKRFVVNAHHL